MAALIPLTDRAGHEALFRLPGRTVTAGQFCADAARLAGSLPDSPHALNLCSGRYAFAVGFAAALLRGQVTLLASDRSPDALRTLRERFPGLYAINDDSSAAMPGLAVPPPGDEQATAPALPGERTAAIVFTSGSTGQPAAHAKTWQALAERSRDAAVAFALQPDRPASILGTVPPHHMYGFETTLLLPLHAPACSWCGPAFYPADIRAAAAELPGPRVLVTTPLQMRALMAAAPLSGLARVISATAPLDPAMAEAAERQWQVEVSEIFGATEVGSIASRRTIAGDTWTLYPQVTVESAADGVMVRAPGAPGVVLDDALELLPAGGFRLLGRRSDLVKLGGRRASLANLNRALAAIDGVLDGVFLPPDCDGPHAGARMTAVVVAPGQASEAIVAALRERIDPAFLPRRVVLVDSLPRNEFGKLPLMALRALAS